MSDERFLSRWVRRKSEAKSLAPQAAAPPVASPIVASPVVAAPVLAPSTPAAAAARSQAPPPDASDAAPPLPPVESLTFESDFTPFMRPGVDEVLKREAIKSLLRDPRFNVMDGLDVYIDDYSKPDPLPQGWLEKMNQVARLGDYAGREKAAEEARAAALAQASAPATSQESAASAEKTLEEQPLADASAPAPADTSNAVSKPSGLPQSGQSPRESG